MKAAHKSVGEVGDQTESAPIAARADSVAATTLDIEGTSAANSERVEGQRTFRLDELLDGADARDQVLRTARDVARRPIQGTPHM
eukprot:3597034-Prymnesium_polylepis.2